MKAEVQEENGVHECVITIANNDYFADEKSFSTDGSIEVLKKELKRMWKDDIKAWLLIHLRTFNRETGADLKNLGYEE